MPLCGKERDFASVKADQLPEGALGDTGSVRLSMAGLGSSRIRRGRYRAVPGKKAVVPCFQVLTW